LQVRPLGCQPVGTNPPNACRRQRTTGQTTA
jgi:hypothetical protein